MEEKRISKVFKNSEIIGRMPNGDLYLKQGVKRKSYLKEDNSLVNDNPWVGNSDAGEGHINYEALGITKMREMRRKVLGIEDLNDEVDNWDTE